MPPLSNLADPRRRNVGASLRQSRELPRDRAAHHRARPGRPCLRHRGQELYRGHGRALVHRARLRQRGIGRGRRRADAQALLRTSVHRPQPRSGDRACRKAQRDRAGADLEGVLLQFRLGGKRHPDQARVVSQQRARPAAEEKDRQPHQGLSRRHRRRRLADRACPAITATSICRCRAFCTPAVRITTASRKTARARRSLRRGSPTSSMR